MPRLIRDYTLEKALNYRMLLREEKRAHSRAASGLVHTHPIGVSHFWEQQGHHLVFIANKETISHAGLESHTKGGILSTHKRRTHHKGRQIMKLPNSRRLKIKATAKLSGATSTWVRQSHYFRPTYTQTT